MTSMPCTACSAGPTQPPKGPVRPHDGRRSGNFCKTRPRSVSATEIAEKIGISRSTAQRYLAELVRQGKIELRLHYGATGRPEHRYRAATTP